MTGYTKFKSSHTNNEDDKIPDLPSLELQNGDHSSTATGVGAPKLQRNSSVSSSTPSVQVSAVKRAFSMRRSSSVSERYCRIHDQRVVLASPMDCDDIDEEMESYNKEKKSSGKGGNRIWKACKRVFRF